MPYSASGTPGFSSVEDAFNATLLFSRAGSAVLGADDHVPSKPPAPVVTKAESADQWIVLTQFPDSDASTLTDCQVQVTKADDPAVFTLWPFAPAPAHRIDQTPYPAKVKARFRNQSAEDAGAGRGWSAWSDESDAAEAGAAVTPPPASGALDTFDTDPHDSRAALEKEVITP